jgi:predicted kinase
MKELVIFRGPSGSGKSTYARSQYRDFVICSADDFFLQDVVYKYDPYLLPQAHQVCFAKFLAAAEEQKNVVIDNTNIHVWEFVNYIKAGKLLGYKISIVEFVPQTVDDIKRCASYNKHGVPAAAVARQAVEYEAYSNCDVYTIPPHIPCVK